MTHPDAHWMRLALAEAERGRGSVEPNPMVGAALVGPAGLIATGHHGRFGGPHAERVALGRAGERAPGATLYVTLEPCCHHGKTPPCTDAVLGAGVSRVVVGMTDPFPKVAGGGLAILREAGLEVTTGVEEAAARRLNAPYLKRLATGHPYVIAKWAMTLDGKIATAVASSQWISGPRSRALVHETRGRVDAVVVGLGTVLADDPWLTARPPGPRVALRVVLDSTARLPLTSRLVRSAGDAPVLVAVSEAAPPSRRDALVSAGCEVLAFPSPGGRVSPAAVLDELGRRGATNVLVEGGGRVHGAFLDARLVDEVDAFIAPAVEGGAGSASPVAGAGLTSMADAFRLEEVRYSVVDGDVRVQGRLPWSHWHLGGGSSDSP